jgi:hypothetical protein
MIAMAMDASEFVPALASADGEALISDDIMLPADPIEATLEAAALATLDFAAIWSMRSGPFFSYDGQLATMIAAAFGTDTGTMATP